MANAGGLAGIALPLQTEGLALKATMFLNLYSPMEGIQIQKDSKSSKKAFRNLLTLAGYGLEK